MKSKMGGLFVRVVNQTRQAVIGHSIKVADNFFSRLIGLLAAKSLQPGEGLMIIPCSSIHTFGMRFPIDVLFLDASHTVLKVVSGVTPGRLAVSNKASYVIELPQGTAAVTSTQVGDKLLINA